MWQNRIIVNGMLILGSYSCLLFLLSDSVNSFGECTEKYNREDEGKLKIY